MLQIAVKERPPSRLAPAGSAPAQAAHPIFGNIPIGCDGCTLEKQPIQMLNFWHKKAVEASDEYWKRCNGRAPDDDPEYDVLYKAKWDTFEAAFKTNIVGSRDIAILLQIVMRQVQDAGDVDACLTPDRLQIIADASAKAAEPERRTKELGPLVRPGNKLTEAGLLFRYQSFLTQELHTLSHELYGNQRYAFEWVHFDDAVHERCKLGRGVHIFLDPKPLPKRARKVLSSLDIDTKRKEIHSTRRLVNEVRS